MRKSCDFCWRRKRKCTNDGTEGSCSMCCAKDLVCTFTPQERRKKKKCPAKAYDPLKGPKSIVRLSSAQYDQPPIESVLHVARPPSLRSPLSPSIATGFLGLAENAYLHIFLQANRGMVFCDFSDLQRAVSTNQVLFNTHVGHTRREKIQVEVTNDEALASTMSIAALWASLANGAILQNSADKNTVQSYLLMARTLMFGFDSIAVPQVLKVHLLISEAYILLQDFPRFCASLNLAFDVAKKIVRIHESAVSRSDPKPPPMLEEGLWLQLEILRMLKKLVSIEVEKKNGCEREIDKLICIDEQRCERPSHPKKDDVEAMHAISVFAPSIDGLPTFCLESLRKVYENGGYFSKQKVKEMARYNMVAAVLTELANPDAICTDALVHLATRGITNILPVFSGLHQRVVQLMRMVVTEQDIGPGSVAYNAGVQLSRIYERLFKYVGYDYFRHPGRNQLCVVSNAAFLRLFMFDENGCLQLLLLLYDNIMSGPGVMRLPFWCHTVQWIAALLLSAGRCREHEELVRMYNSLEFANGANNMPTDYAEKASMYKCRHHQCEGVHHILKGNVSTGRAKIFINHLALPNHNPELGISKDLQLLSLAEKPVASNIQEQLEVQASTSISSGHAQSNHMPKSQNKIHASSLGQALNCTFLTPESHFWGSEDNVLESAFTAPPLTTLELYQPLRSSNQTSFIQLSTGYESLHSAIPGNTFQFPKYTCQHLASPVAGHHMNFNQDISLTSAFENQPSTASFEKNYVMNNANTFMENSPENIMRDQQFTRFSSDASIEEEN